jgi:SAM-dependent methyltransferase
MITKKIFRVKIQRILRNSYLLAPVERLRYYLKMLIFRKKNKRFIRENPDFTLPPSHLAFDAYSSNHWAFYKISGEITAKLLHDVTIKYFSVDNPLTTVYEWGCGPARIIRQLPAVLDKGVEFHASDYNEETIDWCKKNVPGIHFLKNELQPPLPYTDNKFDFIYAPSVFTHLSETTGLQWAIELHRVLKPNGILLITTNSDRAYQKELLADERKIYNEVGVVVRAKYEEGKKMFLTKHNPLYVREKLLQQFEIIEHVPSAFPFMKQDYWIARKRQ